MNNIIQDKIVLISGLFSLGLYALISLGINLLDENNQTYFYLVILFFLLYLNYFFLWKYFDNKDLSGKILKKIIVFSFLFTLTLIFLVPKSGGDFYHYIFEDAVMVSYQQNPYLVSPNDLPYESWGFLSNWQELPSQHGPFKFFLTQVPYYLSQGEVVLAIFLYKVLYSLFFISSLFLIYQVLKILKKPWTNFALLLFAWNPLILFTPHVSGGNDILLLFWTLLAIYMVFKNKFYYATLFLTLSIFIKYLTIFLLPIFFIYYLAKEKNVFRKMVELNKHLLIFLATAIILFLPFWQGLQIFDGLLWTANYFSNNSFPATLFLIFIMAGVRIDVFWFKIIFQAIFIFIYFILCFRIFSIKKISKETFLTCLVLTIGSFMILAKFWIFYKYFVWLIPLIFLLDKKYFSWGVFLTGLVVIGEVYLGYIVALLIPPIITFGAYYILHDKLKLISFNE